MKKNIKTTLIILAAGILGLAAYLLNGSKEKSSLAKNAVSNFAIEDTASVDKIILSDTYGGDGITLFRENGKWRSKKLDCIQGHLVATMLETFKRIKVKGLVPKATIQTVTKSLTAHHKKIEIYQNGKISKTWYIGNPTADHFGTYMLLKDPEQGKSPEPFVMYLPNMHGSLQTRFTTDSRELICTEIFAYRPENIQKVEVLYPKEAFKNFTINLLESNVFNFSDSAGMVNNFDTAAVRNYLLRFKKIHFEHPNYTYSEEQIDSLRNEKPTTIITVTDKNGDQNKILCYRRKLDYYKLDLNNERQIWDYDRLWVFNNEGDLTLCQYHVFNKILEERNTFIPEKEV